MTIRQESDEKFIVGKINSLEKMKKEDVFYKLEDAWIQTYPSFLRFNCLDPQSSQINLEDIAHSLSLQCRFNGHISQFYSVARHSLILAREIEIEIRKDDLVSEEIVRKWVRTALLHDASEAYLCDIPRPIKPHLENYKKLERGIEKVIAEKYDLYYPLPKIIKDMDYRLTLTEGKLLQGDITDWRMSEFDKPIEKKRVTKLIIEPESSVESRITFLWMMDLNIKIGLL